MRRGGGRKVKPRTPIKTFLVAAFWFFIPLLRTLTNHGHSKAQARVPQSSKACQWVEARDWWSRFLVLTNACEYTPGHSPPPASGGLTFSSRHQPMLC
ncbi:hypothetical protein Agabi119p4_9238 [Agaricus bisporus var. burnettii]|uniref:Uncharacterized protein n=1 Tax=Agaricus bisporus var. burnettii TaxID=192524 RepID=A0A8H7C633_AGABI|nr:hypothetical protein Agabi119p4_9238 [Agaricus bisporus var. burnettii]